MRTLYLVVVLEFLVLIGLVAIFTTGAKGYVFLMDGRDEAAEREPGSLSTVSSPGRGAPAPGPTRSVTASEAVAAATVVVHGRLLSADGGEAPKDANVSFRRAGVRRGATINGEHYATPGLSPGRWRVRAQADGFVTYQAEHEAGDDAMQTLDLTLTRAQRVKVFLRTPDGGPLLAALNKVFGASALHVVATETPIDRDLPPDESALVGDFGAGRYRSARDLSASRVGPNDPDGELLLERPAPVHAALFMRHLVLARQVVAPAQTELTFMLDPNEVFERLATVRVRVLDGATGRPVAGASVRLESAQGGGAFAQTDADGAAGVKQVPPGLLSLRVTAKDYEDEWTVVRVPPRETLDLGDVTLHAPLLLRGRLLDSSGMPLAGGVQWTPLDTMTFPRRLIDRRTNLADGDGEFTLGLGRRRYVLQASSSGGLVGVTTAVGGQTQPCEIRLAPAVSIVIVAKGDPLATYVATARDRDGVPIAATLIGLSWREGSLRVPPGDYTLEVHDSSDRLVRSQKLSARAATIEVEVQR